MRISIHAPRVRCDDSTIQYLKCRLHFNPRTSCEVRRCQRNERSLCLHISIHAPRVRCDFEYEPMCQLGVTNFNPRTSCEVRLFQFRKARKGKKISIHAPRVRCDITFSAQAIKICQFQSTHLV